MTDIIRPEMAYFTRNHYNTCGDYDQQTQLTP